MDYLNSIYKHVNDLSTQGFERSCKYYNFFYKGLLPENKNIKILDIGCGAGKFLYFLQKESYINYFGIDISEEQIAFCKKNVTENVSTVDAFKFLNDKKKFDFIVLNDVLEHIKKERIFEFLGLLRNSLEMGGKLLIKVPNMANPFGLQNRYDDITHDIGFTELSLSEVMSIAGFKNISLKGASYPIISFKSFVGRIIQKVLQIIIRFLLAIQGYNSAEILDKHLILSASID